MRVPHNPKITIYGYNTCYDKNRDINYMLIKFTDARVHVTNRRRFTLTAYESVQLHTTEIYVYVLVTFPMQRP
jgi:hypothetical protein